MAGKTALRVVAFGEEKVLAEWARDPRCRVSYEALRNRLKAGIDPETALSGTANPGRRKNPVERKRPVGQRIDPVNGGFTAYGETKPLSEWASDPRCKVSAEGLRFRLRQGMSMEEALVASKRYHDIRYEAFGDEKTLVQWSSDPRCKVSRPTLSRRLAAGMSIEEALGSEPVPRELRGKVALDRIAGFGEMKSLAEWARDPRSQVTARALARRLRAGVPLESAVRRTEGRPKLIKLYSAFGESKNIKEWAKDERCAVSEKALGDRLRGGMAIELALSGYLPPPEPKSEPQFEAFGESKSMKAWLEDPRCRVKRPTVLLRMRLGRTFEQAI